MNFFWLDNFLECLIKFEVSLEICKQITEIKRSFSSLEKFIQ